MSRLLSLGLLVGLLAGCATRTVSQRGGDDALLACIRQRPTAQKIAGGVAAGVGLLLFPPALLVVNDPSVPICLGDAGWIQNGNELRPMTPTERDAWPTRKAAIQAYEQARADSIRKP